MHVWVLDAPLTTRVALNMMGFEGRDVGRSAKSFEVQHVSSTHRLSAKGSHDASLHVESTRAWRFCGCVRGRATPGPSNARDNAFGWASGWWRAPESCVRCLHYKTNSLVTSWIIRLELVVDYQPDYPLNYQPDYQPGSAEVTTW